MNNKPSDSKTIKEFWISVTQVHKLGIDDLRYADCVVSIDPNCKRDHADFKESIHTISMEEHKRIVASLQKQNEIYKKSLEFYADQDNWVPTPSDESSIWKYTTIYDDSEACDALIGGKKARQGLKEAGRLND